VFLARPYGGVLGPALLRRLTLLAAWSAVALIGVEIVNVGLQVAVLVNTVDLPVGNVLRANFALAGMLKTCAALGLAVLLWREARGAWLLLAGACELAAATLTTHAAARLSDNALLLGVEFLHQLGAAIWIGGIPCFVLVLAALHDGQAFRLVGARFSRMSMLGVACILASGATMSLFYRSPCSPCCWCWAWAIFW
jgi:putative copper resistance protein D